VERVKELLARPAAPPPPPAVRSEDLEERESAFDFLDGRTTARVGSRDVAPPAPPESAFGTEALTQFTRELGTPAPGSGEPDLLDAELESSGSDWLDEEEPAAARGGAEALGELESFDFEFDGARTTVVAPPAISSERSWPSAVQVGEDDIARETVVNPASAGDFDVSFRDLRSVAEPVEAPPGATTRRLDDPDPAAFDDQALSFEAPAAATPARAAADEDLLFDAGSETRLDDAPAANDAWEADLEPVAHPATDPAPAAAEPAPAAITAPRELGNLAPLLRQQIHESLEKIAWEAFGDLAERIVPQVLEKVEAVAWEVIPQMAEALIQEEIRKLKGER
jgi:hypothetical protein